MKIVINTSHQRFGGAVQVALSFIHECCGYKEHEFHVWVGSGVRKSLCEADFPPNFSFYHFDFGLLSLKKTFSIQKALRKLEQIIQPDVIIATSGPTYFHSKAPQIIGFNLPLYIYPESPHVQSWSLSQKIKMRLKKMVHFYFFRRDAAAYVVQTDDVNQRVRIALRTEKVYTVTNTHNHFFDDWQAFPPKLPKKQNGVFRFITISSWYPHKNLDLIPEVQIELRKRGITNVEFVLTLKPEDFEEKVLKGDKVPGIHNIGPIPPEACPSLYQECDALFLPTLAECFSASYPEAMKMEKPIVTTDLGFSRSICGQAAIFFTPKCPFSAANKVEKLIQNEDLRKQLARAGVMQLSNFDTPQRRTYKYVKICERYAKVRQNQN
ncbi:MAG: glycosyltransferase [Phaeodactylibacter sp.]|uniref:glycosyltransferase family 4 protein n=1 Tax=Phaeodactylibacter sp. TaxID=1940289 RepID=UPI0032EFD58D